MYDALRVSFFSSVPAHHPSTIPLHEAERLLGGTRASGGAEVHA